MQERSEWADRLKSPGLLVETGLRHTLLMATRLIWSDGVASMLAITGSGSRLCRH